MTLIKKFILTALLKNISEALFRSRTRNIVQAQVDHPITDLDPPVTAGSALIVDLDKEIAKRDDLSEQLLQNTEKINKLKKQLNDLIVDSWMPTVQKFCNGDAGIAKMYFFGIKGEYDGASPSPVSVKSSYPSIVNTINNAHLQVTIELENNVSKEIVVPNDGLGIDVYILVADTLPEGNYKKTMHYSGRATRGKYTVHCDADAAGKTAWILAAYVPKPGVSCDGLFSVTKVIVI